jgi:hypothetical protein
MKLAAQKGMKEVVLLFGAMSFTSSLVLMLILLGSALTAEPHETQ